MKTAKLFNNGKSQAVRLPKSCRFEASEVYIKKFEGMVLLLPKNNTWSLMIKSLDKFSDDFLEKRNQLKLEKRIEI